MIFSYFLVYLLMEEMCDIRFLSLALKIHQWTCLTSLYQLLQKDRMDRMRESETGIVWEERIGMQRLSSD